MREAAGVETPKIWTVAQRLALANPRPIGRSVQAVMFRASAGT
jgi:hypothetical protein